MTTTVFAMKMEEFYHVTVLMKVTKNLCNLKKKRIKCLNFIKNHCDLNIFHRQLFFDVSVGGGGYRSSHVTKNFRNATFQSVHQSKPLHFSTKRKIVTTKRT